MLSWQFTGRSVLAIALLAASCTGTTIEDEQGHEPIAGDSAEQDVANDTTVDELLANIASMDLSADEQLEYLYERAVDEGQVTFYGVQPLRVQDPLAQAFQDEFSGIDYEYIRIGSDDMRERLLLEQQAGRHIADVISVQSHIGSRLRDAGLLAEHHGVPVPDSYPADFVGEWSVGSAIVPHVISWNTNTISDDDAPQEWDDFLLPDHSGCVIDSAAFGFTQAMVLERGFEGASKWFQAFIDNDGEVRRGHSEAPRALASGEIDCAVYTFHQITERMISEDDAPLNWHAADPSPAAVTSFYISQDSPNPHAAALLMHWLLDVEGAQVIADHHFQTVHPEVKQPLEGLRPWHEAGSELERRLLPVHAEEAGEIADEVEQLIDTYLVPNLNRN